MNKLIALLLSAALAVPAGAGNVASVPAPNAPIGGSGGAASGAAAASLAPVSAAGLAPSPWVARALWGHDYHVPTPSLAQGMRQSLPVLTEAMAAAARNPDTAAGARQVAAALSQSLDQNLKNGNQEAAAADAALISAISGRRPKERLKTLAKDLEAQEDARELQAALGQLEIYTALEFIRVGSQLSAYRLALTQAIKGGTVEQFLAQRMDQSGSPQAGQAPAAAPAVSAARGKTAPTPPSRGGLKAAQAQAVAAQATTARDSAASQTAVPAPGARGYLSVFDLAPALGAPTNGVAGTVARPLSGDDAWASAATDRPVKPNPVMNGPLVRGELQADFVNVGMGPTGMMAMIAAVASGKTAVGVEIRAEPQRGVHQNIREEWFHVLGLIDKMMLDRYGEDGVPKLPSGKPFMLADVFYNPERVGGHLDFNEIYGVGDSQGQNVAGRLSRISFEDAREATVSGNDGKAKVFVLPAPTLPDKPDPAKITGNMQKVLDSPSSFQVALINYELMLRAYINAIQAQDKASGRPARIKTYENHRVAVEEGQALGYVEVPGDRRRIVIEEVVDKRGAGGAAQRVHKEGTPRIDLGAPKRFALSMGFGGGLDAKTLGYKQEDVKYADPATGQEIAGKQNWIVGEVTANIGGQLIRRISTIADPRTGEKHTVRQIAVGHENAPNVAWVPVQVPAFMDFDPVAAGKVPAGSDPKSAAHIDARKALILDYFVGQVSAVTHIPEADIRRMRMFYGPNFFTLQEKIGHTARVAANGNVAGDLMGNGHFLTSGGSMTGMIGHTICFLRYWDNLSRGVPADVAARVLEDGIKTNSEAWLHVSQKEFDSLGPANFGAERAAALGVSNEGGGQNATGRGFGLAQVLGQQSWADSFRRLFAGEFGKAGEDFYVPEKEVDVTAAQGVTVQRVTLAGN
ncbi:MAG: hypothetical protein HYZ75_14940 [Elusimicrobia bacterium]|nr:hypothetical protein [Elusimicrobiota bacterium]